MGIDLWKRKSTKSLSLINNLDLMEFLQLKLLEAGTVSGEVSCNSYSSCFLEIHLSLPRDRMHSQMTPGSYFATCLLLIIFVQLPDPGMDAVQASRFS